MTFKFLLLFLTTTLTLTVVAHSTYIDFDINSEVYSEKDTLKLEKLSYKHISDVNNFVSPYFEIPSKIEIVISPEYFASAVGTTIYTNSINNHLFIHEYAHILFEIFLKTHSKYFYNDKFNPEGRLLSMAIFKASKKKEEPSNKDIIDELYTEDIWFTHNYTNSSKEEKQTLIYKAQGLLNSTDKKVTPNQFSMDHGPFHELFADVLPTLLLGDGEHMHKSLINHYKRKGITDPKNERLIEIKTRNFVTKHKNTDGMTKPHYMTGPTRNLIWKLSQEEFKNDRARLLFIIGKSIASAFDEMALKKDKSFGVKLLNEYLIKHIKNEIN